jgi:hypothetical protein
MFIRQHPYCEMESVCVERTGHAAPSTDVHHIKGVVEHPELAFECVRQLDLAPFDRFIWPHLLVNLLSAPGRSEALRRP